MSESIELTIYPSENNLQNMKYKIGKKESILGKNKSKCDVPLIFSDISDVHAKFTIKGQDDYIIRDLNSENGVFLVDPKTGTKQRINPGKDYEVRPDIPFYVSQYKCVFLKDENSKSNENSSIQKPLIKKQMPVYAKKFKPKNSSQSDSKEEIDDETAFKTKIQEENQKRLKELKEIEEKTGEENETEEKRDPENPSIKNNSIDEENQAIVDFELEKKKNIDKNLRINQLKRVTSIKSDSGDELDQEKKKILMPDENKNEKKSNYEQELNPSESQKLIKKKTKDDVQKKVQFIEPEKKETKQIVKDEAFEQKKKKFVMEEAKSMERQTSSQIEEPSQNSMNEVLEKNKTETNHIKKTTIQPNLNKKPENPIKETKIVEEKQPDNPKQETDGEKIKKKPLTKKKLVVQEVKEEKEEDKPEEANEEDIFNKYQHKAQNKIKKKEQGKTSKEENEKPELKIPEKTEPVQGSTTTIKIKKAPLLKPKNVKKEEEVTKQEKKVIPQQSPQKKMEEKEKSTSKTKVEKNKVEKNNVKKLKKKKKSSEDEEEESNDEKDESSPEISDPEPKTIGKPKPKPKPRQSNTSHPKPKSVQIGISGFILGDGDLMILKDLGFKVIENKENPIKYLILQSFKRTIRMMMALNRGIDIIDKKWLDDCIEQKEIPDPMNYIFKDKDSEKKFGFKFEESLTRARENYEGVFYGYSFWVSRNVAPSYDEVKLLILSGRGNILNKKPLLSEEKTLIIMSKEENEKVENLKEEGFYVYSTEFIFSGCLRQKMEFENNLI